MLTSLRLHLHVAAAVSLLALSTTSCMQRHHMYKVDDSSAAYYALDSWTGNVRLIDRTTIAAAQAPTSLYEWPAVTLSGTGVTISVSTKWRDGYTYYRVILKSKANAERFLNNNSIAVQVEDSDGWPLAKVPIRRSRCEWIVPKEDAEYLVLYDAAPMRVEIYNRIARASYTFVL